MLFNSFLALFHKKKTICTEIKCLVVFWLYYIAMRWSETTGCIKMFDYKRDLKLWDRKNVMNVNVLVYSIKTELVSVCNEIVWSVKDQFLEWKQLNYFKLMHDYEVCFIMKVRVFVKNVSQTSQLCTRNRDLGQVVASAPQRSAQII